MCKKWDAMKFQIASLKREEASSFSYNQSSYIQISRSAVKRRENREIYFIDEYFSWDLVTNFHGAINKEWVVSKSCHYPLHRSVFIDQPINVSRSVWLPNSKVVASKMINPTATAASRSHPSDANAPLFNPIPNHQSMFPNLNDEIELARFGLRVGSTLGIGTYAKVKSAFSEQLSHKVAIKIINRRKAPTDFQRHFLPRELTILQQIVHSHIVQVYDIFSYGSKLCIVMELAKTDLLDYIKLIGRLSEDKARAMFTQLMSAVDYLHQLNIVHRRFLAGQCNSPFLPDSSRWSQMWKCSLEQELRCQTIRLR